MRTDRVEGVVCSFERRNKAAVFERTVALAAVAVEVLKSLPACCGV